MIIHTLLRNSNIYIYNSPKIYGDNTKRNFTILLEKGCMRKYEYYHIYESNDPHIEISNNKRTISIWEIICVYVTSTMGSIFIV